MRYRSTRGGVTDCSFIEAVLMGLAPDRGLLVPKEIPAVDAKTLESWKKLSFPALATEIISLYARRGVWARGARMGGAPSARVAGRGSRTRVDAAVAAYCNRSTDASFRPPGSQAVREHAGHRSTRARSPKRRSKRWRRRRTEAAREDVSMSLKKGNGLFLGARREDAFRLDARRGERMPRRAPRESCREDSDARRAAAQLPARIHPSPGTRPSARTT